MHRPDDTTLPRLIARMRRLGRATDANRISPHRYDRILLAVYLLTIILAAVPMVRAAFTPLIRSDEDPLGTVSDVSTWQVEGTGETVTIPHAFADVAPGQTIRLITTVDPSSDREDRCLYVGMSHAHMRVLANGAPLTDYGSPDTLPSYLHGSAPPASFVLRLPTARKPIELTVELTAPEQGAMHIEDVFTGSLQGMRVALLARMGGILCSATGLLAFGILEFVRSFIAEDRGIRWQGMLAFSLGCWATATSPASSPRGPSSSIGSRAWGSMASPSRRSRRSTWA